MITQDEALNMFEYRDGVLLWKNSVRPSFNGKEAGYNNGSGYRKINIKGIQYYVHRIIYLMQHGKCPKIIDHIDRNPSNNKIENLREATSSQNAINSFRKRKASSGVTNVSFNKKRNKYGVYVRVNCKNTFFGSFDDLELAELVAQEAKAKHYGIFNVMENK
jgi:hypothetical protein